MMIMQHRFLEFIPDQLEEGILYVSIEYCTAIHLCVCGCRNKVVTPISPTDWRLTFNGKSISLHPSIGNWNFDCQSHYWIRSGVVEWSGSWSNTQILENRKADERAKDEYYLFEQGVETGQIEPRRGGIMNWILKVLRL